MECHSLMAVNQRHSDILHKDFEIKAKTEDRLSLLMKCWSKYYHFNQKHVTR